MSLRLPACGLPRPVSKGVRPSLLGLLLPQMLSQGGVALGSAHKSTRLSVASWICGLGMAPHPPPGVRGVGCRAVPWSCGVKDGGLQCCPTPQSPATAQHLLGLMDAHLKGRDWLAADHATIADVAMYSYTAHAPEGGVSLEPWAEVRAWLQRVEALPRFVGMQRSPVPDPL